jgi:hypothetical protein
MFNLAYKLIIYDYLVWPSKVELALKRRAGDKRVILYEPNINSWVILGLDMSSILGIILEKA